jgi:hypothetical protein
MAEKISVEIDLEGGAEVEKQLADIGKSGQQAFSDIQNAADQVNLSSTSAQFDDLGNVGQAAFNKIQSAAQKAVVFEQVVQGVTKVEGAFEALGTAATRMATRMTRSLGILGVAARSFGPVGIALGVLGGAFVKFGDDVAGSLSQLTAAGAKLDLTAGQFDKVKKALTNLGISNDAIVPGLTKLKETFGAFKSVDFATGIISSDLTASLGNFIAQLEGMPDSVQRTQLAMSTLGDALGAQVIAGLQTGTINAANFKTALAGITPATQEQIAQAARYEQSLNRLSTAWTQFKSEAAAPILTPAIQFLTDNLKMFGEQLAITDPRLVAFKDAAVLAFTDPKTALNLLIAGITNLVSSIAGFTWDAISGLGVAAWNALTGAIENAINAVKEFIGLKPSAPAITGGATVPAMAGGGLLGGRGSGTSDSNLAWVSRGEYITPARAVAQPGVLHFLEALRRSGGNLRGVLDGLGHFALGGLVPRPIPAFAAGGAVGGMSNVTIQFPGLPAISGLRASSDVVDQLHRAAALAQVRSGGRKPSRYS